MRVSAEVVQQVAGPEQRPSVGGQGGEEDGRSFHVTLQTHEAYRDVHAGDVVGVTLRKHTDLPRKLS